MQLVAVGLSFDNRHDEVMKIPPAAVDAVPVLGQVWLAMNSAVDRHCTLVDILWLVDTGLLVDNLFDVVTKTPPVAVKAVPVLGQV